MKQMLGKFYILVARVAKIMDSRFKDADTIYSYSRSYRIKFKKILKKAVCLPEDNHETRIVEREVKKITGLNTN